MLRQTALSLEVHLVSLRFRAHFLWVIGVPGADRDLHPARAELAAVIQKFDRVFESNLGVPVARRLPMNVVGVAADTQTLAARILHANQRGGDTEERHCSPQCS